MSQNDPYPGPSWPGGSSDDEPYAAPADPWGEHAAADPSWGAGHPSIPHQPPFSFSGAPPGHPPVNVGSSSWAPTAGPKRNTPIVALVVLLGLLIVAGLGATAWLIKDQRAHRNTSGAPASPSVAATAPGAVAGSEDARFVAAGQCVINRGSGDRPDMRKSVCTTGTYLVLKVVKGQTSGATDAERKCAKVAGYTNWFYYDSDLDDLDLVLCLKKQ